MMNCGYMKRLLALLASFTCTTALIVKSSVMVVHRKMYVHYGRVCGCALWEGVWMCIMGGCVDVHYGGCVDVHYGKVCGCALWEGVWSALWEGVWMCESVMGESVWV